MDLKDHTEPEKVVILNGDIKKCEVSVICLANNAELDNVDIKDHSESEKAMELNGDIKKCEVSVICLANNAELNNVDIKDHSESEKAMELNGDIKKCEVSVICLANNAELNNVDIKDHSESEKAMELNGDLKKCDISLSTEMDQENTPWHELSAGDKSRKVLFGWLGKTVLLLCFLYLFICSLDFMGSAFRLVGAKAAGHVFTNSEIFQNPIAAMMMGVLTTVLVQSSSTSSSIIVTMVSSNLITVQPAIYFIMGANIGTSVTNTIVALGQVGAKDEFRLAFAGATVHDMFNWLTIFVLLPLEYATRYLYKLSSAVLSQMDKPENNHTGNNEPEEKEYLTKLTRPFTSLIVQIDDCTFKLVSKGIYTVNSSTTVNKKWCEVKSSPESHIEHFQKTFGCEPTLAVERCKTLFSLVDWSDEIVGVVLLVVSILSLVFCLIVVVKILNSIFKSSMASAVKRFVNADFPGPLRHLTGYVAILVGAGVTFLVQSSSIFTSTLTPLVGVGVLSLERMYPLCLGSNIGTTATAMLASLAASQETLSAALQVALCHLFFNISGLLLWYPIPFMRDVPMRLAQGLGNKTAKYRWFAIVYIVVVFFGLPATVFGLSLAGTWVLIGVGVPVAFFVLLLTVINVLQKKKPKWLPEVLRSWNFIPWWMRSLKAADLLFKYCICCRPLYKNTNPKDCEKNTVPLEQLEQNKDPLAS